MNRRPLLLAAAATALARPAMAQGDGGYPSRPIRVVIPFPPGGGLDGHSRFLARPVASRLGPGASVVIENRPGGASKVGTDEVRRAPPDGHTIVAMPPIGWVGYFYSGTYDTKIWEEMTPIAQYATTPYNFIQTKVGSGLDTWAKVVAKARGPAGSVSIGGPASGGLVEYTANEIFRRSGIRGLYVPYRGSAPAMTALLAGDIDMTLLPLGDGVPNLRANITHGVAVSADARFPVVPDVPTFAELDIAETLMNTFSYWGPPGVPPAIVERFATAVRESIATPEFQDFMEVRQAFKIGFKSGPAVRADVVTFDREWGDKLRAAFATR